VDRTNAERQRRYVRKLKAEATQAKVQDITGLRQENVALRQENVALRQRIAVLEQEPAQAQATAKPRQQRAADGASEKIETTMAKAKANEALRPAHWPTIPPWVPAPARHSIVEERKRPGLDEDAREALNRLTIHPKMKTDVWKELKELPPEVAEFIIPLAIYAFAIFPLRHQRLQWETWAKLAIRLRNVLAILRDVLIPTADEIWTHHWPGDPAMNISAAISFLDALAHCFQSIAAKYQPIHAELPPVARPNDPQAPWRYFSQYMSNELKKLCCEYYDHVVDVLIAVVFDLPVGPGKDKVYSWRTMLAAKAPDRSTRA
jgi:hypothetical protein